jgi:predicted RNase H-like HicB family nuclease
MRYPIAIEPGGDSTAFGVVVPDVPGAFSAGDTLEEAIANAEDGILLALEEYLERGEAIPQPSKLIELVKHRDFKGWTWALAEVDLAKLNGKAVRLNITLPERLVGTIDAFARAHGETRSGFLARAAIQAMTP